MTRMLPPKKKRIFPLILLVDRISLYSSGCSVTQYVDHAGLEIRALPASLSAFPALGITKKGNFSFIRFSIKVSNK